MSKELNLLIAKEIKRIIEALLFSTHEPISFAKLKGVVSDFHPISQSQLERILDNLQKDYASHAFELKQNDEGYFLHSREEYSPYVAQLHHGSRGERLSAGATEVLAIIAHRQPLTRPMVDAIRGVDSSGSIHTLLERGLIESAGKKQDAPGRPTLYRTSRAFLEHFGMRSLDELTLAN